MFGQKRTFYEHMLGMGPFALAIIAGLLLLIGAPLLLLIVGLVGVGFVLHAKWRLLVQRKFITYGYKEMNSIEKRNYFIGYGLLAVSVLSSSVLLLSK